MIMKWSTIGIVAATVAAAVPAHAQGKGGWSGGYVGGHVGYGFLSGGGGEVVEFDTDLDGTFADTVRNVPGADAFSPGFCGGIARGATPADGCAGDSDGIDVGVRAGYDMDLGGFVLGGLAEVSYVDVRDGLAAFSITPASYSFSRELDYLAAARLRAGFAFDRFLVYGTGGVAWGGIDHRFESTNMANAFTPRGDKGAWGYQFGGGVETRLSSTLSIGLEYLHTSLDDDDYTVRTSQGTAPATNPFLLVNADGTDLRRGENRFDVGTVRLTVSYRFGG